MSANVGYVTMNVLPSAKGFGAALKGEIDPALGSVGDDAGKKTGSGHMKILESRPAEGVRIQLDFTAPMQATNVAEFTFKPAGQGTEVAWVMTGHNNFVGRAFSVFFDMDKMVGNQFAEGLADMKSEAEKDARATPNVADAPAATTAPSAQP